MNVSEKIAEQLLTIKAVTLSPKDQYTWSSGIKSPIYCDNRLTLSFPQVRDYIKKALANLVKQTFFEVDYIMGTATAGISHAALVADLLQLPMGYVRTKSKEHGKGNRIEGKIEKGSRVVIIEDLISTGGSALEVAKTLKDAGMDVLGVVSIFTYNLKKGYSNFSKANLQCTSLSDYDVLIKKALELDYINKDELKLLLEWKSKRDQEYRLLNE